MSPASSVRKTPHSTHKETVIPFRGGRSTRSDDDLGIGPGGVPVLHGVTVHVRGVTRSDTVSGNQESGRLSRKKVSKQVKCGWTSEGLRVWVTSSKKV